MYFVENLTGKRLPTLELNSSSTFSALLILSQLVTFHKFSLQTNQAIASVNVREGAYRHTANDNKNEVKNDKDDTKLFEHLFQRTYNSRSAILGIFGFGWCSRLDSKIRRLPNGELSLATCDNADEIIFQPAAVPMRSGPSMGAPQWRAENAPGESLSPVGRPPREELERVNARGEREGYDLQNGRLIGITDRAGSVLKISYDSSARPVLITFTKNSTHEQIEVKVQSANPMGLVESLQVRKPRGETAIFRYRYSGLDLIEASTTALQSRNWISYQYDNYHNLIAIRINGRLTETIDYDATLDRVNRVTGHEGENCELQLYYQSLPKEKSSQRHLVTQARTKCAGSIINEKRFDFWYEEIDGLPQERRLVKSETQNLGKTQNGGLL
jgi:YD repeat-containing protein